MHKKIIFMVSIGVFIILLLTSSVNAYLEFENLAYRYNGINNGPLDKKGTNDLTFKFKFNKPLIENILLDGTSFDRVVLSDLSSLSQPNKPILPVKPVSILLPQKTKFKNIEIVTFEKIFLGDGYKIKFGKDPIPTHIYIGDIDREIINCEETYSNDDYLDVFPDNIYSNVKVHNLRGYSLLKFNLHPIFYEFKNGALYYYKEIEFKVNVEECDKVNPLFRDHSNDKDTVANRVGNPLMLNTYSERIEKVEFTSSIVSSEDEYEYVIITNERLKSAVTDYTFQILIDYKIFKGLTATIVTVEDIVSDPFYWNSDPLFNDTQAQIRNFIKDAYMNWNTEYILLGGDCDIIPFRELFFHYRTAFQDFDELIPSDLYYACLDGNYNSNENIIWGEPKDGEGGSDVDLVGEVYVGRAPVNSWDDLSNFVRKTLAYEQTQDPYISDVLMCGEYMGSGLPWGGDAKDIIADIIPEDYDISKLYDRDWSGHNWPKSELISRINDNINFINHLGHANYQYAMKMYNSDIDSLTNNEFFFVYSQGCNCGGFDKDDCFGEELITSYHGAFAAVMNTRSGWMYRDDVDGPSQKFDKEFFKAIFNEGITQIGKANQKSKEKLISLLNDEKILRYCYYELTLLGDPEISLKIPESKQHDVAVSMINSSTYLAPDTPTSISATITNYGETDETNIIVKFLLDEVVLETKVIDYLASQGEQILNFVFSPTLGVHDIKVEIQTIPGENIIYNNFKQKVVLAGPDININCEIPEPIYYTDETAEFEVTINNLGVVDVQNINLKLLEGSNVVDSTNISYLAGGDSYTTTISWAPSNSKWYDLTFYVQPVDYETYISVVNNYYNTSIYSVNSYSTLFVDDDGDKDFKSIKQALYWACPNVTIYVYPGKYCGRILLDSKIDIIGLDRDTTIIYGYTFDYIIKILIDQITIKGFTFREADRGIRIVNANGCVIEDNAFLKIYQTKELDTWKDGAIVLLNTSSTVIRNNYIFNTDNGNDDGMKIEECTNCTIENNTIVYSGDGIYIYRSKNIHIHHNTIDGYSKFCSWGIRTDSNCHDNIFEKNTIFSNAVAMVISGGHNNLIKENMIFYNRLRRCTYFTEGTGIYIEGESNSVFKDNLISINLKGIVVLSSNNLFYQNNIIKNDLNAKDDGSNSWNNSNIGNYWSDYTGYDNDSNGIGDTPYEVPGKGNNKDNYPVMDPFGPPNQKPEKPAKPSGPTNGKVGVAYTYKTSTIDPDGVYIQYGWDWDGDDELDEWKGLYESGEIVSASHTWEEQGTYSIRVKARDIYGFESEWSDPLEVTMPRNKPFNYIFNLLSWLLARFPNVFPILRYLLGL